MSDSTIPAWLAGPDIERAIRLMPGLRDASLVSWSGWPLAGGGECLGVWRIEGHALVAGKPRQWSIVLKGWNGQVGDSPPTAWNWPLREMELYRSGILEDLPGGIRAPRCFGNLEREDGTVWVWLEDITDGIQAPWPIERYAVVARQLGQFNGTWLVNGPLPDAPFLSRNWLRGWVEASRPAIDAFLVDPDLARQSGVYPDSVLDAYASLWARRQTIYDEMARLPQTFGHLDAFSRNIFVRERHGNPGDTILIDWSFAGTVAIGEDLVPLVGGSVGFMDAPVSAVGELAELALEGYIAGLADAGWRGDAATVRRMFHAALGLRYGIGPMRLILFGLLDPSGIALMEKMFGHPIEKVTANTLEFNTWVVQRLTANDQRSHLSSPTT